MLAKILAIAKLLNSDAFKQFVELLMELFADKEPLFGSANGNAEALEFKELCAEHGVPASDCDSLCDKLCA